MKSVFLTYILSAKKAFLAAFLLLCGMMFNACTNSVEVESAGGGEDVSVQLTIRMPGTLPVSRAVVQTGNEYAISEIQVLVFENGIYKYKSQGNIISTSGTSTTFTALLRSSTAEVKLYILANSGAEIAAHEPVSGYSESQVTSAINRGFAVSGISSAFPMFGACVLPAGLTTGLQTLGTVNLLRAIARVDVNNMVDDFRMSTVQVFRANNQIQVIPTGLADYASPAAMAPSVPAEATANVQTTALNAVDGALAAQLYLPESVAPDAADRTSSATCIVVGGYYKGSSDITYYRADFNPETSGHPFGQILRNYVYTFNVNSVSGPGWDTPEDAANNASTSIVATVTNWDSSTIDMSFDGNNHFGLSTRKVALGVLNGSTATISVSTNLPGYTLQWSDASGVPQSGSSPSTTIQNPLFSAQISSDGTQITVTALADNTSGSVQIQYLLIHAGRWDIVVKIDQAFTQVNAGTYINILSISTGIGYLGSTSLDRTTNGNSAGFRSILMNSANFGVSGKVVVGGINLDYMSASNAATTAAQNQCRSLFEQYDIINVTYSSNPDAGMSSVIKAWLNAKPNRVLMVTRDDASTNTNLISLCGNGTSMWTKGVGTGFYQFVGYLPGNTYFTLDGPFGALSLLAGVSIFTIADATWMGINPLDSYAVANLTPVVVSASSLYAISVDMNSRIVYIGDSNLYQSGNGLDTAGSVTTDAGKLIGNLFAWAINKVILPHKVSQ